MTLPERIIAETSEANKLINWLKSKPKNDDLDKMIETIQALVNSYEIILKDNSVAEVKEERLRKFAGDKMMDLINWNERLNNALDERDAYKKGVDRLEKENQDLKNRLYEKKA